MRPHTSKRNNERRCVLAHKGIENLMRRIRGEYLEMPGLCLTPAQAQRLWGLTPHQCETLMRGLLDARFLRRTRDGSYVLFDVNSPGPTSERRADRPTVGAGAPELILVPAALSGR